MFSIIPDTTHAVRLFDDSYIVEAVRQKGVDRHSVRFGQYAIYRNPGGFVAIIMWPMLRAHYQDVVIETLPEVPRKRSTTTFPRNGTVGVVVTAVAVGAARSIEMKPPT